MKTSSLFSAMVSGVVALSSVSAMGMEKTATKSAGTDMGECHGVNSCKGKGACGGKGHSCAGKNTCKGKGWEKLSKEECTKKKGTFKPEKSANE